MPLTLLRGVVPAHLTPFKPDGELDLHALRRHVQDIAQTPGVTAMMSNGHAGQASALSRTEKRYVLERVLETAGDAMPILTGLVADSIEDGVQLAADARAEGASALVVFPLPSWKAHPERAALLMRYLDRLVERTDLPLVIFQQSVAGGSGYDSATLLRACNHTAVIAVKEGSGSVPLYEAHLRAISQLPQKVSVLTTHSTWLLSSLALGGDGILSGMGSVTPHLHVALLDAIERSHLPGARAINDQLWNLTKVFYSTLGVDPHSLMKVALVQTGKLPSPAVRPPLLPVSALDAATVRAALIEARMLRR